MLIANDCPIPAYVENHLVTEVSFIHRERHVDLYGKQ